MDPGPIQIFKIQGQYEIAFSFDEQPFEKFTQSMDLPAHNEFTFIKEMKNKFGITIETLNSVKSIKKYTKPPSSQNESDIY